MQAKGPLDSSRACDESPIILVMSVGPAMVMMQMQLQWIGQHADFLNPCLNDIQGHNCPWMCAL
jgi:hypothetical protein